MLIEGTGLHGVVACAWLAENFHTGAAAFDSIRMEAVKEVREASSHAKKLVPKRCSNFLQLGVKTSKCGPSRYFIST